MPRAFQCLMFCLLGMEGDQEITYVASVILKDVWFTERITEVKYSVHFVMDASILAGRMPR